MEFLILAATPQLKMSPKSDHLAGARWSQDCGVSTDKACLFCRGRNLKEEEPEPVVVNYRHGFGEIAICQKCALQVCAGLEVFQRQKRFAD